MFVTLTHGWPYVQLGGGGGVVRARFLSNCHFLDSLHTVLYSG